MYGKKRKIASKKKETTSKKVKVFFKDTFPEIFAMVHPTLNKGMNVEELTRGSGKEVWFICPISCGHHIWLASITSIAKVRNKQNKNKTAGCPFCYNRQTCECQSAGKLFPHLREQFDIKKNGDLDIMKLAPKSKKEIWWLCDKSKCEHPHSWLAKIAHRSLNKSNCPFCCSTNRKVCPCNSLGKLYPHLMLEFDQNLNPGIDVYSIAPGSNKKINWCCNRSKCDHHVWNAVIKSRTLRNCDCPFCVNIKTCPCDSFATKHPELLKEFDLKMNADIDPFTIAPISGKLVWWKCLECEYGWQKSLCSRTFYESGCLRCTSSKMEKSMSKILKELNINFEMEKRFSECRDKYPLPFDVYIEELKILIEVDGEQHFRPVNFGGKPSDLKLQQHHDQLKNDYAKKEGFHFLRISYSESKNIKIHLENFFEMVSKSKDRVEMFLGTDYKID
jgi:very-short-patch-repair endonuclease